MGFEQAQKQLGDFLDQCLTLNYKTIKKTVLPLLSTIIEKLLQEKDPSIIEKSLVVVCANAGVLKGCNILQLMIILEVEESVALVERCTTIRENGVIQSNTFSNTTAFTLALEKKQWKMVEQIIKKSDPTIDPYTTVFFSEENSSYFPLSACWYLVCQKQIELATQLIEACSHFDPNRILQGAKVSMATLLWHVCKLYVSKPIARKDAQKLKELKVLRELVDVILSRASQPVDLNVGPQGDNGKTVLLWAVLMAISMKNDEQVKQIIKNSSVIFNPTIPIKALQLKKKTITMPEVTVLGFVLHKKKIKLAKQIIEKAIIINNDATFTPNNKKNPQTIWDLVFALRDKKEWMRGCIGLQRLLLPFGIDVERHAAVDSSVVRVALNCKNLFRDKEVKKIADLLTEYPFLITVRFLPNETTLLHVLMEAFKKNIQFPFASDSPLALLIERLRILKDKPNAYGIFPADMTENPSLKISLEPKKSDFQVALERALLKDFQLLEDFISRRKTLCGNQKITLHATTSFQGMKETERLVEQIMTLLNAFVSLNDPKTQLPLISSEFAGKINRMYMKQENLLSIRQQYSLGPDVLEDSEVEILQRGLINLWKVFQIAQRDYQLNISSLVSDKIPKNPFSSYSQQPEEEMDLRGKEEMDYSPQEQRQYKILKLG